MQASSFEISISFNSFLTISVVLESSVEGVFGDFFKVFNCHKYLLGLFKAY